MWPVRARPAAVTHSSGRGGLTSLSACTSPVVAVKEGAQAWQGEGCCVSSPLDGVGFVPDDYDDECC
jgi:hypothetical protein